MVSFMVDSTLIVEHLKGNKSARDLIFSVAERLFYGFDYLITFDSDFLEPCKAEGVKVISSKKELEKIL